MWLCGQCNHVLRWNADFTFEEVGIYDKEGISSIYSCSKCDIDVEVNISHND